MTILDETGDAMQGTDLLLTRPEAERLTEQIGEAVTDVHALILQAMQGRADRALGYSSWNEYVNDRFPTAIRQVARDVRPELVEQMRSEGKSLRAIASVLGISPQTAMRDASTVPNGTVPDRVTGLDGKSRPASRPTIDDEELETIERELHAEFGDNITVERVEQALDDNADSKRAPAITKPDLGGFSHPARYSTELLPIFAEMLDGAASILDPFAGTGERLASLVALLDPDVEVVGIEIEPEWAGVTPEFVRVGNALALDFPDATFDAIVTSPTYGNRLADHHDAIDPESRRSYTHDLGRALADDNSGDLQWGDEYREFHKRAWSEADRVLRPGGRFVLNIKDHIRGGERQRVTAWHVSTFLDLGYNLGPAVEVGTSHLRQGTNAELRAGLEMVFALEKP